MMLDHLGHREAHNTIMQAIESVLRLGSCLTPDMGGSASTTALTDALIDQL
jgi:tartrate dehydrogenase/decarboxylase/D-malate dehydrogenase